MVYVVFAACICVCVLHLLFSVVFVCIWFLLGVDLWVCVRRLFCVWVLCFAFACVYFGGFLYCLILVSFEDVLDLVLSLLIVLAFTCS